MDDVERMERYGDASGAGGSAAMSKMTRASYTDRSRKRGRRIDPQNGPEQDDPTA